MSNAFDSRPCLFISGAAVGIGRATARLFVQQGWFVGIGDIDQDGMVALEHELGSQHCLCFPLDVSRHEDWTDALARFHAHTGRLDLLVNNAGIMLSGPFEQTSVAQHLRQIGINVHGVLLGCHAAHPYLRTTPSARVINLASSAAFYGQAALASYSASKFFVRGLTEALNIEWQHQDIRVMDLMPLFVQTGLLDGNRPPSLRRLGVHLQAEDVARVLWQAAQCPRWSRVHWPVGLHARMLYKVMAFTPDWLNRLIAHQIAT